MSDALIAAYAEFKRLLIAEKGRDGAAEVLAFAAAWMLAEAEHERGGNVVEFRKPRDAA